MKRSSAAQATVVFYVFATANAPYKYSDRHPSVDQQNVSSLQRSTFQARQPPCQVDSPTCPSSNPSRGLASVCFIFALFTLYLHAFLVRFKQLRPFCKDVWQLKTFYEVTMTGSWSSWGKYSHLYNFVIRADITLDRVQCTM